MAYVYLLALGFLALSGVGSVCYYYLMDYTDETNLFKMSAYYDGRRYTRLYKNRDRHECGALKWKASSKPPGAKLVTPRVFDEIVKNCKRNPLHRHPYKAFKMYPGTKWCGRGHLAKNYTDLGTDVELDKCCRTHDHCPLVIHSRIKKFGVKNSRFYTSSHCSCDDHLYSCLKHANSASANIVGKIYFNYLRVRCFIEHVTKGKNGAEKYSVRFRGSPYY